MSQADRLRGDTTEAVQLSWDWNRVRVRDRDWDKSQVPIIHDRLSL